MHSTATTSSLVTVSSRSLTLKDVFENKDFTSAFSSTAWSSTFSKAETSPPLLEDQEDILPPGSSDGKDLCSYMFGLHGGRRALRHLSLTLSILLRGHRNLSFLLLLLLQWPQRKRAVSFLGMRSWGGGISSPFVSFFGVSPRDAERGLRKIPIFLEAGWDSSLFWISN